MKKQIRLAILGILLIIVCLIKNEVLATNESSYCTSNTDTSIVSNVQNNITSYCLARTNTFLFDNGDNTLTKVNKYNAGQDGKEYLGITVLNSSFQTLRDEKIIPLELDRIGGVFSGKDYNFVVFGQDNKNESDDVEVVRVVKYDKNWNRLAQCSIKGINTYTIFKYGNCRMAEYNGSLIIYTCHEMYKSFSSDGYNHQANLMLQITESNMVCTYTKHDTAFVSAGYVSHSYNQFIKVDGTNIYTVDHGDAHPRGITLYKYNASSLDKPITRNTVFTITGTIGDNYTGLHIGGLEISSSNCLIVGNSVRQLETNKNNNEKRNVFLIVSPKDNPSNSKTIWLTNNDASGKVDVSIPYIVKINNNRFAIVWELEGNTVYGTMQMVVIDGAGNKLTDVITLGGRVSKCEPILFNNEIVWDFASSSLGKDAFFHLDLSSNSSANSYANKNLINNSDFEHFNTTISQDGGIYIGAYDNSSTSVTLPYYKYPWVKMVIRVSSFTDSTVENIVIPGEYKISKSSSDKKISPFQQLSSLKSITLEEGIENISENAFYYCKNLEGKIIIPSTVKSIGDNAFTSCNNIEGIELKNSNTKVGELVSSMKVSMETGDIAKPYSGVPFSSIKVKDESILKVSSDGTITALKEGTTTVDYYVDNQTYYSFRATVTVTKSNKVVDIILDKTNIEVKSGNTEKINVTYNPSDATDKTTKYTSSDTSIATVAQDGTVTGVNAGTATITVTCGNITKTCEVKVIQEIPIGFLRVRIMPSLSGTYSILVGIQPANTTQDKTITYESLNPEIATVDSNGKIKVLKAGEVTFKVTASNGLSVEAPTVFTEDDIIMDFPDVGQEWYYSAVEYVYKKGLMSGYTAGEEAGKFGPNDNITRGQIVTILYRMENIDENSNISGDVKFDDVKDSSIYYYNPINWAAKNGIVTGYKEGEYAGKFLPDNPITREELAIILQRYAKYKGKKVTQSADLSQFGDYKDVSDWAENSLKWTVAVGIISGNRDTEIPTIKPHGNATRAEAATMIKRFCENIL